MDARWLLTRWSEVREGLVAALDQLDDAQLDFRPGDGLWSIRETVVHVAGTEAGWLRCYVEGRWHEDAPAAADFPTRESLKELLAREHAVTEQQLSGDADALLAEVRDLPWGGRASMAWVLWHVVEHEIHHRGEIFLMLGLLGMEGPDV